MSHIYGIGIGPGDPELLTLRAVHILQQVRTVFVPSARSDLQISVAERICNPYISSSATLQRIHMPMTEERAVTVQAAQNAAKQMIEAAQTGEVAFVTLGDAMLYSTWTYVLEALRELSCPYPITTIPGISSINACAARAELPLAQGREPLLICPSTNYPWLTQPKIWENLESPRQRIQLVIMKAKKNDLENLKISYSHMVIAENCHLENERLHTSYKGLSGNCSYFTTAIIKR